MFYLFIWLSPVQSNRIEIETNQIGSTLFNYTRGIDVDYSRLTNIQTYNIYTHNIVSIFDATQFSLYKLIYNNLTLNIS